MPSTVITVAQFLSVGAFFGYGVACFVSRPLRAEFERWGCESLRKITGALQILGSLGLLAGFAYPWLRVGSAGGLALMMVCAAVIRARVRDPLKRWIPALVLLLVNALIALS